MRQEPGLMVGDKLAQLEPRRGCPVLITNETSKAFELKKGNVVAQLICGPGLSKT